jgi:uncharacterized protein
MNEPETIRTILENAKTIAVVGLSDRLGRASLGVSRYLQQQGYRIVPVNPMARSKTILGEQVFDSLDEACAAVGTVDVVDVFRAPMHVPEIVKDVIRLKIPNLWLQEGVCHEEAAGWAEADGIKVVMDHCMLREHMAWVRNGGRRTA